MRLDKAPDRRSQIAFHLARAHCCALEPQTETWYWICGKWEVLPCQPKVPTQVKVACNFDTPCEKRLFLVPVSSWYHKMVQYNMIMDQKPATVKQPTLIHHLLTFNRGALSWSPDTWSTGLGAHHKYWAGAFGPPTASYFHHLNCT